MKHLEAKQFDEFYPADDFSLLELHPIGFNNWNHPANVNARFGIGFDANHIFIRFRVQESNVRAVYKNYNDPVHEDSCVEFFISFEPGYYYNLEFNCIGTIHGQYGTGRQDRKDLEKELLETIRVFPSLGTGKLQIEDRETDWTLDVIIPIPVFKFSNLDSFVDKKVFCNFYKCGDKLPGPHYLSWNPVKSENPDFHRPEYFGVLKFG